MYSEDNVNDKITLEIARELASKGDYDEAIKLLSPLYNSEVSVDALILLGKIYAQKQDFKSAENYFSEALKLDENNKEAEKALNKCQELKNSSIKTYYNFNKMNFYTIIIAVLLVVGCLAIVSNTLMNSSTGSVGEESVLVDADLFDLSFKVSGDSQSVLLALNNISSNDVGIVNIDNDGLVTVTTDKDGIDDVLNVLSDLDKSDSNKVSIKNISLYLSDDTLKNVVDIDSQNVEVIPVTITLENIPDYSTQLDNVNYILSNDEFMKVKVVSKI